jgi:hypothetical protein
MPRAWSGFLAALMVLGIVASASAAALSGKPQPPCRGETFPAYPAPGESPAIALWTATGTAAEWMPPTCTAWHGNSATLVVGLAARFYNPENADALLARIGAISALRGVRYWSVTDKKWNAMFTRASAMETPKPESPRGDFSPAELRSGRDLFFLAADNRSGDDAVSRLHVRDAGNGRLIIETANVTPLRWFFISFAAPDDVQTWYFLEHETGNSWRFYSFTRVLYASRFFSDVVPNASYINRAVAMYRYIIGAPTDRDPPAAP